MRKGVVGGWVRETYRNADGAEDDGVGILRCVQGFICEGRAMSVNGTLSSCQLPYRRAVRGGPSDLRLRADALGS